MLYHAIGAVAALAVIALSYFALRALVRHAGLPSVWGQLGVMAAATVAAAMPLIGTINLPAQMLEGASSTGFVCLCMMLLPRIFFKEIWGESSEEGK